MNSESLAPSSVSMSPSDKYRASAFCCFSLALLLIAWAAAGALGRGHPGKDSPQLEFATILIPVAVALSVQASVHDSMRVTCLQMRLKSQQEQLDAARAALDTLFPGTIPSYSCQSYAAEHQGKARGREREERSMSKVVERLKENLPRHLPGVDEEQMRRGETLIENWIALEAEILATLEDMKNLSSSLAGNRPHPLYWPVKKMRRLLILMLVPCFAVKDFGTWLYDCCHDRRGGKTVKCGDRGA